MKTMFRTEANYYTDCEGRHADWTAITEYTTKENAMEATKTVTYAFPYNGNWRVVARTMDEATFTVTDEVVATFDWWKEVGRKENAKRMMEVWAKEVAEAEAIKAKTEKGEARKAKKVAEARARYEEYRKVAEG